MEHINQKIHNYRITRLIGEGGMATVYEAVHQTFEDRKVAIKILNPILTANKNIRQRFVNEAKIMASLTHPNIVHVLDFEQNETITAIVMELLEGCNLAQYIALNGPIPTDVALYMMQQILDAFSYAHQKGVIHRDIKPSNIFITSDSTPKILDFGIAKLIAGEGDFTTTGIQMGTLAYMSPEQVKDSKHIDLRSDIYSLGVTFFDMLSGKKAYDTSAMSDYDLRKAIVELPFPKLVKSTEYQPLIDKATAKLPEDRFQTCAEFKNALLNPASLSKAGRVETNDDKTLVEVESKTLKEDNDKTLVETENPSSVLNAGRVNANQNPASLSKAGRVENPKSKKTIPVIIGIAAVFILVLLIWRPWQDTNTGNEDNDYTEEAVVVEETENRESNANTITETINGVDIEFIEVAGGTFQMGSNDGESDEQPVHSVTVSDFYIGKYEVTQAQWRAVMGSNPAKGYGVGDNYPVYYVSWNDIHTFLQKLKQLTGKTYRLPTEAEWEYAAGGGSSNRTKWAGTNSESSLGSYAWFTSNSGNKTHPVGTKSPNRLGIYDMSGNVYEWCSDGYASDYYNNSPQNNPKGPSGGSYNSPLVRRGGSWCHIANRCRVAYRSYRNPFMNDNDLGLRLVFVP